MKKAWTTFRKMAAERSTLERPIKAIQFSACNNYANVRFFPCIEHQHAEILSAVPEPRYEKDL